MTNSVFIYKSYLKKKGFDVREPQQDMIRFIDNYLSGEREIPAMIEAGTGTGKTLGYSIPAITHALESDKKVVISTATVALQDQILNKDLPDLRANSGLKFAYMVAKGRSNYICVSKAQRALDEKHFNALSYELKTNAWTGEIATRDLNAIPTKDITATKDDCAGKFCPDYDSCPYYEARSNMADADVLVTNHSFLLADLAMGGGVILPEPSKTVYALDEFHQFAHKVKDFFNKEITLTEEYNLVGTLRKKIAANESINKALDITFPMEEIRRVLGQYSHALMTLNENVKDSFSNAHLHGLENNFFLLKDGNVPNNVQLEARKLFTIVKRIPELLEACNESIYSDSEAIRNIGDDFVNLQSLLGELNELTSNSIALWACYSRNDKGLPLARWVTVKENTPTFHVSPVTAAKALHNHLWKRAYAVVGSSATISANGDFSVFLEEIGTDALTMAVPSPYDYEKQANFELIDMGIEPKDDEFNQKTANWINDSLNWEGGNLVLFTSFTQMKAVYSLLEAHHEDIVIQGDMPKTQMIEAHTRRIEKDGKGSTIFGLDSFAEGISLEKDLLTHVVITRVSFDAGNDPISKTLHSYLKQQGRNPFTEIMIPKTCIKLIQSVGRLIRTSSDYGTISLLDNRVITKPYGKAILASLPMTLKEECIVKQAV